MKTYKLIKTYPGSFPLGHLAILDESVKYYNLGTTTRSLDYIENHPENWQHVCYKCYENINTCKTFGCKKDYEILSFIATNIKNTFLNKGEKLYLYRKNSTHFTAPGFTEILEKQLLNHNAWSIHSVKRLSDGEVFTIGDKITNKSKYNCIINSIELNPNYPQIMFNRLDEGIDLINAKHIKQPLFTTEDGVDIFAGNTYIIVTDDLFECRSLVAMGNEIANVKRFSTKKAAENYIKMNKPCLSLNDVLSITNKTSFVPEDFSKNLIKKELTKIVKQKLK